MNLEVLNLSRSSIRDNALAYLHDLPNLKHLNLSQTKVSKWSIENFIENRQGFGLPKVNIQY